jgi:manganese transport protein
VVPYNLFLHASAARRKWQHPEQLKEARQDTAVSLGLGGIISMSIVITSATAFFGTGVTISGGQDMAGQLAPLLGNWSEWVLGAGLFTAGISSAVTAPMAAAYATSGILGWKNNLKDPKSRGVWITILVAGTVLSATGVKPVQAILFAQVANGILLPVIAFFLLKTVNNKRIMGAYRNNTLRNLLGLIVVSITLVLGIRSILSVLGVF